MHLTLPPSTTSFPDSTTSFIFGYNLISPPSTASFPNSSTSSNLTSPARTCQVWAEGWGMMSGEKRDLPPHLVFLPARDCMLPTYMQFFQTKKGLWTLPFKVFGLTRAPHHCLNSHSVLTRATEGRQSVVWDVDIHVLCRGPVILGRGHEEGCPLWGHIQW